MNLLGLAAFVVACSLMLACTGGRSYNNYDIPEKKDSTHLNYSKIDTSKPYEGMSIHDMAYQNPIDTHAYLKDVLWEEAKYLNFSDPTGSDKFECKVIGDKYYRASIQLSIRNQSGSLIYSDIFPCKYILEEFMEGGGEYGTEIQKEHFIKNYIFNTLKQENITYSRDMDTSLLHDEFKINSEYAHVLADPLSRVFMYKKNAAGKNLVAFMPTKNKCALFYEH